MTADGIQPWGFEVMSKYRTLRLGAALIAFISAGSIAQAVVVSPSTYVYNFKGTCAANDCTGFGVGQLTLNTSSTTFSSSNFVSFTYMSNLVNFTISSPTEFVTTSGSLINLPGPAQTLIQDATYTFVSNLSGSWSVGRTVFATVDPGPIELLQDDDNGPTSVWTAAAGVPEPASWAMMIAGFGAVGCAMRRRKVAVRFA